MGGKIMSTDNVGTQPKQDTYGNTDAGGAFSFMGIKGRIKVKTQNRCPEGYYWVAPYVKKTFWRNIKVQGHCRKAGSFEQQQQMQWEQQQKEKMAKLQIKQAKAQAKANKYRER